LTQTKSAGRTELSVNEECDESAMYTRRVSDRYRESVRLSILTNPEPLPQQAQTVESITLASLDVNLIGADVPSARQQAD
jgi:hypothetical protein